MQHVIVKFSATNLTQPKLEFLHYFFKEFGWKPFNIDLNTLQIFESYSEDPSIQIHETKRELVKHDIVDFKFFSTSLNPVTA